MIKYKPTPIGDFPEMEDLNLMSYLEQNFSILGLEDAFLKYFTSYILFFNETTGTDDKYYPMLYDNMFGWVDNYLTYDIFVKLIEEDPSHAYKMGELIDATGEARGRESCEKFMSFFTPEVVNYLVKFNTGLSLVPESLRTIEICRRNYKNYQDISDVPKEIIDKFFTDELESKHQGLQSKPKERKKTSKMSNREIDKIIVHMPKDQLIDCLLIAYNQVKDLPRKPRYSTSIDIIDKIEKINVGKPAEDEFTKIFKREKKWIYGKFISSYNSKEYDTWRQSDFGKLMSVVSKFDEEINIAAGNINADAKSRQKIEGKKRDNILQKLFNKTLKEEVQNNYVEHLL